MNLAHDSSRRLRPMITELNFDAPDPSLMAAVKESRLMLQSGKLELGAHMPDDIDGRLSRQAILMGSLFVREAATNAMKYARRGTTVDLFAEIVDGELSLTMANEIGNKPSDDALAGGYGLMNLKSRIESEKSDDCPSSRVLDGGSSTRPYRIRRSKRKKVSDERNDPRPARR